MLLILALAISLISCQSSSSELNLKVLTWNTGLVYLPLEEVNAERANPSFESRTRDEHLPHIARTVASADPDFIALQEVRDIAQAQRLGGLLGGNYNFLAFSGRRDRYAVIYYRSSFEVLGQGKVILPGAREFPLVKVRTRSGHRLSVVSIHLSAFDVSRRNEQIQALLEWLDQRAGITVLAGDFNFDPRSSGYQRLTEKLLDLTDTVVSSNIFGQKIDYVFLWAERFAVNHQTSLIPTGRIELMDHHPIVVQMKLRRSPRPIQ